MCSVDKIFQNVDGTGELNQMGGLGGKVGKFCREVGRLWSFWSLRTRSQTKLSFNLHFVTLGELLNLFVLKFHICKVERIVTVVMGL